LASLTPEQEREDRLGQAIANTIGALIVVTGVLAALAYVVKHW
jgi:crotonobetainyl-CoA:carnitine CoA-transferase CaiB-like acyl-CoA transferase